MWHGGKAILSRSVNEVRLDATRPHATVALTSWIPRAHDDSSIRRVLLDLSYAFLELIHPFASVVRVTIDVLCTKVSPLEAIDRTQVPNASMLQAALVEELSGTIAIPDLDALLGEMVAVRIPLDEPEEFFDNTTKKYAFGGQERKCIVGERETKRRRSEYRECAGTSAVWTRRACLYHVSYEVEVLIFFMRRGRVILGVISVDRRCFCRGAHRRGCRLCG